MTINVPDRWDRPWNTLAFLCLSSFLWAVYGHTENSYHLELFTVMATVVTMGAFWDLSAAIRIPRSVSFLHDRIELERLFLSKLTWATSELEVQEKAGGLAITNTRLPERPRWLNTMVLPRDYPRLEEIRELLTERVAVPRKK